MSTIDFLKDHPECDYPTTDLSCLKPTDNMDNIGLLTRQMRIKWPQFSWQAIQGDEKTRIYQKFCEDISRVGYDNRGQIWSIICPQFGDNLHKLNHNLFGDKLSRWVGSINVEITVTGVRGWIDEVEGHLSADVGAKIQIWMTSKNNRIVNALCNFLGNRANFPFVKGKAVGILLHAVGDPNNPLSRFKNNQDPDVEEPSFTQHKEAATVGHISMEVGSVIPFEGKNARLVNVFNKLIADIASLRYGNMTNPGQTIKWNIWLDQPEDVIQTEWQKHAEYWRDSLELDGVTPVELEVESDFQLYDGRIVNPTTFMLEQQALSEFELIKAWVRKYVFPRRLRSARDGSGHDSADGSASPLAHRIQDKDDPFTEEDNTILMDFMKD